MSDQLRAKGVKFNQREREGRMAEDGLRTELEKALLEVRYDWPETRFASCVIIDALWPLVSQRIATLEQEKAHAYETIERMAWDSMALQQRVDATVAWLNAAAKRCDDWLCDEQAGYDAATDLIASFLNELMQQSRRLAHAAPAPTKEE